MPEIPSGKSAGMEKNGGLTPNIRFTRANLSNRSLPICFVQVGGHGFPIFCAIGLPRPDVLRDLLAPRVRKISETKASDRSPCFSHIVIFSAMIPWVCLIHFYRHLAPGIAWLKYVSQFYYGLEAVSLTQWLLIDHISTSLFINIEQHPLYSAPYALASASLRNKSLLNAYQFKENNTHTIYTPN